MKRALLALTFLLLLCSNAYAIDAIQPNETGLSARTKINEAFGDITDLKATAPTTEQKTILGYLTDETDVVNSSKAFRFPPGTVYVGQTGVNTAVMALGVRNDHTGDTSIVIAQDYTGTGFENAYVYRTVAADTVPLNDPAGTDVANTAQFTATTTADELIHTVTVATNQADTAVTFDVTLRLNSHTGMEIFEFAGNLTTDATGLATLNLRTSGNPVIVDNATTLYVTINCSGMLGRTVGMSFVPNLTIHRVQLARSDITTADNIITQLQAKTGDDRLDASAIKNLPSTGAYLTSTRVPTGVVSGTWTQVDFNGVHFLADNTVTTFAAGAAATFGSDTFFAVTNNNTANITFDLSAHAATFSGSESGNTDTINAGTTTVYYHDNGSLAPISNYNEATGTGGASGDHPVVLTRDTPSLADLGTIAGESVGDNSGLWLVASDQISSIETNVDSSIMIRSLRSGILDANGAEISTTAVQKSGVILAGGTVVRVFSATDLRVVSGPLMAAGSRYPDIPVVTSPLSLVGNQIIYNTYRNRTLVLSDSTGTFSVYLPSLQNALDLSYLDRNDVFAFRNDTPNDAVFRIRTFQVGTFFSSGGQTIDLSAGQTLVVSPAPSGAVWQVLALGQNSDINTETITLNTDWYRDEADATAADNSVRLHYNQTIESGLVRDHILVDDTGHTNNPISLRFQHRNVQDDIAWIQWWTTWDSSVPSLGGTVEEIEANIPTALTYINSNIASGFDFEIAAPDSVLSIQSIGWISGNEVRITLHSAFISPSFTVNHPVRINGATNSVHNGVFLIDSIGTTGSNITIHITNPGVTDGTTDETAGGFVDVPVYADVVFISNDLRQVNFNLYKDSARTSLWTTINSDWFDPEHTGGSSVLSIGYNTDIQTLGSQLALQDDAGDWFSVKGGPRNTVGLLDNRTSYVSSGVYTNPSHEVINIDTLGIGTFYIPEHPNHLEPGESRVYRIHAYSTNGGNDTTVTAGSIGQPITFDEGFLGFDILPGNFGVFELYNDGTTSGVRILSPVSKSSSSTTLYTTASEASVANTDPLPMSFIDLISSQNEDINSRFFAFGSPADSINMRANADYTFVGSVEVLFNGTEGTGMLFVPVTLMPIINGDDKEEFAHTVSLVFSRNGQTGSSAPKFSHTLKVAFEWQGSVNDTLFYDVRFGTFPAGYDRSDIQVRNWKFSQTAELNLD